jgi:hypothetical protein
MNAIHHSNLPYHIRPAHAERVRAARLTGGGSRASSGHLLEQDPVTNIVAGAPARRRKLPSPSGGRLSVIEQLNLLCFCSKNNSAA